MFSTAFVAGVVKRIIPAVASTNAVIAGREFMLHCMIFNTNEIKQIKCNLCFPQLLAPPKSLKLLQGW